MFSTLIEKYKMISLTKFQGMKKEFSLHRNWSNAFKLKLYTGLTLLLTLPNILEVDARNWEMQNDNQRMISATQYLTADNDAIITKDTPSGTIPQPQQKKTVRGIVTDAGGQPMPGVTIPIVGTTRGGYNG